MDDLLIRCSSLFKIMGTPKKKGEFLTQTAKTYIESLVDEVEYNYYTSLDTKEVTKGLIMEDSAISLLNEIHFTEYEKNKIRLSNDWITGECDIHQPQIRIRDIKCPWSKKTFPKTKNRAYDKSKKAGYPYQGVGYMWLYDVDEFCIDYMLVDTPEFLIEWEENKSIHYMHDVPLDKRHTEIMYYRDVKIEEQVKIKVEQCREYAFVYRNQIKNRM